jgi:hypothetical protein
MAINENENNMCLFKHWVLVKELSQSTSYAMLSIGLTFNSRNDMHNFLLIFVVFQNSFPGTALE